MKLIFVIWIFLASIGNFLGMFKGKEWFWNPEKSLEKHPFLASQNLYNAAILRFFGKTGVVVINTLVLVLLWCGLLFIVVKGK